jgi:hypothetical protein
LRKGEKHQAPNELLDREFERRGRILLRYAFSAMAWDYGHRDFVLPARIYKIVSDVSRFQVLCIGRGAFFPSFALSAWWSCFAANNPPVIALG